MKLWMRSLKEKKKWPWHFSVSESLEKAMFRIVCTKGNVARILKEFLLFSLVFGDGGWVWVVLNGGKSQCCPENADSQKLLSLAFALLRLAVSIRIDFLGVLPLDSAFTWTQTNNGCFPETRSTDILLLTIPRNSSLRPQQPARPSGYLWTIRMTANRKNSSLNSVYMHTAQWRKYALRNLPRQKAENNWQVLRLYLRVIKCRTKSYPLVDNSGRPALKSANLSGLGNTIHCC